jgi:hypothetical protein
MVTRIFAQLFTENRLRESSAALIDAFEHDPVAAPTHWASVMDLRDPYSRRDIELYLSRARIENMPAVLYLKRATVPRYLASFAARDEYPAWITIESELRLRPEDPAIFTEFTERIAARLLVDFGLLDLAFEGMTEVDEMNACGYEHAPTFVDSGPSTLYATNFFGPARCLALGGSETLVRCGFSIHTLSNGVAVCDLLAQPWARSPSELKAAQLVVLENLRRTEPAWATRGSPKPGARIRAEPQ